MVAVLLCKSLRDIFGGAYKLANVSFLTLCIGVLKTVIGRRGKNPRAEQSSLQIPACY